MTVDVQVLDGRGLRDSPAKISMGLKCSFFQEDNNGTIHFGVKHIRKLKSYYNPKLGLFGVSTQFGCAQGPLTSKKTTSQSTLE